MIGAWFINEDTMQFHLKDTDRCAELIARAAETNGTERIRALRDIVAGALDSPMPRLWCLVCSKADPEYMAPSYTILAIGPKWGAYCGCQGAIESCYPIDRSQLGTHVALDGRPASTTGASG
jgi:hypothetical protein